MKTPRKILVTGAGGFLGHQLAHHLVMQGHQVTGADVSFSGLQNPTFERHVADVRDRSKMRTALQGVEVVFHLASAHLQTSLDASEYRSVNVDAVRGLLEEAESCGVLKFIHVSSVAVYGDLASWPADESTACAPQNIYGATKLEGEGEVRRFSERTSFPTVILRPTWVFGATCPRTRKLYRALRNRSFIMIGNGENLRHPLYVVDFVEGFEALLEAEVRPADVFILGGDRPVPTRELVETICAVYGFRRPAIGVPMAAGTFAAAAVEGAFRLARREPPISRRTLEFFNTNNAFNTSKAAQELGFVPRFTLEEGLRDCRADLEAIA